MLSREHIILLRKIKRSKEFEITNMPESIEDDIWYLIKQKYIKYYESTDNSGEYTERLFCSITPLGKAAISERYRENRHWYIPVIISLIALIKSFLPEITAGAELLLKLIAQ